MLTFSEMPMINYEGAGSDNPLAFRFYNPEEHVLGKPMKEHLKFSLCYWHAMLTNGADPFGHPTALRPWDEHYSGMDRAKVRLDAFFELAHKLQIDYFGFHELDLIPEAANLDETQRRLDTIMPLLKEKMKDYGITLHAICANLFSNPRYMHGAATSCEARVFAHAAAQVKKALDMVHELEGDGFIFWSGRDGYDTLLNSNTKLELDNLAYFLQLMREYAAHIGFKGALLIEPKPQEPMTHQYDNDVAAVSSFLHRYGLEKHFKLNIEANHATLAGHSFQHEVRMAMDQGLFGSIDANRGDLLVGWDTDQFPSNIYDTTQIVYELLRYGGFEKHGCLALDAKVRRASFEPIDIVHGHISGMDAFAVGLKVAAKLLQTRKIENFVEQRYQSYEEGIGAKIKKQQTSFAELSDYALQDQGDFPCRSGRQEMLESYFNQALLSVVGSESHAL